MGKTLKCFSYTYIFHRTFPRSCHPEQREGSLTNET